MLAAVNAKPNPHSSGRILTFVDQFKFSVCFFIPHQPIIEGDCTSSPWLTASLGCGSIKEPLAE